MLKGIAFPTCISVNNIVGHFCPAQKDDASVLKEGDVVKIDFAVHLDGYISPMAHTMIATDKPAEPVTGRTADVICAAYFAGEAALHLMRPGNTNTEVTAALAKVAADFGVNVVEGTFSHHLKRFELDSDDAIAGRPTHDQKVDELKFEAAQAWAIDIVMSTGEGKPKQSGDKGTVFKRTGDKYLLKQASSRELQTYTKNTYETMAWSIRSVKEALGVQALMGLKEMGGHDMINEYPVLQERPKDIVAQFKFTVLIMPSKTEKLNSAPLPYVSSEKKVVDPSVLEIMQRSLAPKKSKKKGGAAPALVEAK